MSQLFYRLRVAYFTPKAGMFRAYHGISTCVAPTDLELYRSLLPEAFSMPQRPKVMLFVIGYTKVVPWPMTRYLETLVFLVSSYGGEGGWYVITMPVTKQLPMQGGRAMGFPKRPSGLVASHGNGPSDGGARNAMGWAGAGRHNGARSL